MKIKRRLIGKSDIFPKEKILQFFSIALAHFSKQS